MANNKYNFDWTQAEKTIVGPLVTDRENWTDYCERATRGMIYEDTYLGCVRTGELCFDIVTRTYDEDIGPVLTFDLYVGGVIDGTDPEGRPVPYAYSQIEPDYPYEYAEGDDFDSMCDDLSFEAFKELAEDAFTRYINDGPYTKHFNLPELARKPLHIW